MSANNRSESGPSTEAHLFARYLVNQPPSEELVARYVRATQVLGGAAPAAPPGDVALVSFACRWPGSLPFLDAASGFLRPEGLLRKKILLFAAILETSVDFGHEFLPRKPTALKLLFSLLLLGVSAIVRLVGGLLLYPLARRSQS